MLPSAVGGDLVSGDSDTEARDTGRRLLAADALWQASRGAVPQVVRRGAKAALRLWGRLTARARPLPDFLIIGTRRGGTTSLSRYLRQHPQVAPTLIFVKGVKYFDENWQRGQLWYRSHFPTVTYRALLARGGVPVVSGEASPSYLFHPLAARRPARTVPEAKLIVLLRNPIDRAFSHWKIRRMDGREPHETFERALAAESERLAGERERIVRERSYYSFAYDHHSYLTQSLYYEPLCEWLRHYPRERLCVVRSEDLFEEPQRAYERVVSFLGLRPHRPDSFRRTASSIF